MILQLVKHNQNFSIKLKSTLQEKLLNKLNFLTLITLSAVARAIAPPDPPSPIIIEIIGILTFKHVECY